MSEASLKSSSTLPTLTTEGLISDAIRDAVGQTIAILRRQWEREHALMEAQAQTTLATQRAEHVEAVATLRAEHVEAMARLDAKISERLAGLRDGERGPDGKQGETGAQGAQGPAGKDGEPGAAGDAGARGDIGPTGPPGPSGTPGAQGALGEPGPRGFEGPVGPQGAPGKLPMLKAWGPDTVFYAGDVVAHAGSTFQALRDTGQEPPHRDWIALALAGITPRVRGVWTESETYRALDIVALNGGSFVARHDEPGACPGGGWQSLVQPARHGKAGEQGPAGERGPPGPKGLKGDPGPRLLGAHIDRANYRAIVRMSDGTETTLELRELFEQFHRESQ